MGADRENDHGELRVHRTVFRMPIAGEEKDKSAGGAESKAEDKVCTALTWLCSASAHVVLGDGHRPRLRSAARRPGERPLPPVLPVCPCKIGPAHHAPASWNLCLAMPGGPTVTEMAHIDSERVPDGIYLLDLQVRIVNPSVAFIVLDG